MPDWVAGVLVVGAFTAGLMSSEDFRRSQMWMVRSLEARRKKLRKGLYKNDRS